MIRAVAPKLAAIALGLAIVVSPAAALPALATPSIPIPPPSGAPQASGTGKTMPAEILVNDVGTPSQRPAAATGNGSIQPLFTGIPSR